MSPVSSTGAPVRRALRGAKDGKASRVSNLLDGGVGLVAYKYLGAGTVVGTAYPQPDLLYTRYAASNYDRLDRFGRVTEDAWETNLATDVSFYEYAISWDRNSNITRTEDAVHTGFDVLYSMDEIDRLVDAQEGTWNGSSITSETRQQEWTLSHTGNWDLGKLDLNGDGDWGDADEYQDARTHNAVNELLARDTDNDSTDDFTLSYDEVGNLIDDGEDYKYVYDPFGRLRKVKNQANTVVAEYRYNGLGFQISRLKDTDDDGDADGSDTWFHVAFDEAWRGIATFRADDTSPKEEFVVQLAGRDGYGGSSYINGVVCRDKDNTEANWLVAADGTLEYRFYYCQNWRGDVVALINSDGAQVEHARYTSNGVPIGMPGADTDSDGDCDSTDITQIQTWIDAPSYDVRGDVDLDGDVDATDKSTAQGWLLGKVHGWEVLGSEGSRKTFAGYELATALTGTASLVRYRVLHGRQGRWNRRDPQGYAESNSLLEYAQDNPQRMVDPMGTKSVSDGLGGVLCLLGICYYAGEGTVIGYWGVELPFGWGPLYSHKRCRYTFTKTSGNCLFDSCVCHEEIQWTYDIPVYPWTDLDSCPRKTLTLPCDEKSRVEQPAETREPTLSISRGSNR